MSSCDWLSHSRLAPPKTANVVMQKRRACPYHISGHSNGSGAFEWCNREKLADDADQADMTSWSGVLFDASHTMPNQQKMTT